MGHAFNQTLMDTLIRHARMQGSRTLWQMGTDHAGIATQMLWNDNSTNRVLNDWIWAAKLSMKKYGHGKSHRATPSRNRYAEWALV